jgi:small subunit ribosomal protein S13
MFILNTEIPKKRIFRCAIRKLYGIGLSRSLKLSFMLGLHSTTRFDKISIKSLKRISVFIERSFNINFELKRRVEFNILLHDRVRNFKGSRHFYGLPTRGQRTHTNASTARKLLSIKNIERDLDKNRSVRYFNKKKLPLVRKKIIKKVKKLEKKKKK